MIKFYTNNVKKINFGKNDEDKDGFVQYVDDGCGFAGGLDGGDDEY